METFWGSSSREELCAPPNTHTPKVHLPKTHRLRVYFFWHLYKQVEVAASAAFRLEDRPTSKQCTTPARFGAFFAEHTQ